MSTRTWVGQVVIRSKGMNLLLISIYLHPEFEDQKIRTLHEVRSLIKLLRVPYLIGGIGIGFGRI